MKTTPTETDREAARVFDANCQGLRAYLAGIGWCIVSTVRDSFRVEADAIDTDDDATKGVMLGQLRAAAGQPGLYVVAGDPDLDGVVWWSVPRRFAGRSALSRTEGAALVAAKRALAEAPK